MTLLAFALGTVIGITAGVLILSFFIIAKAEMPDIEDMDP